MTTTDLKPNTSRLLPRALLAFGALVALTASSQAAILAAWDDFGSGLSADNTLTGFSGTIAGVSLDSGNFGSNDGTFGTIAGAISDGDGVFVRNTTTALTLTITNNTGAAYNIESLHFDFGHRGTNTPSTFDVTYTSGGLGPSSTLIDNIDVGGVAPGDVGDFTDFDYTLSSLLSDIVLDDGESAVFTFNNFVNRTGTSSSAATMDNFLIQGTAVPEPSSVALVGLAGAALLLRRRRNR